ncbi:uncharacterized protein LOC130996835 [Salvia miltiorrhiza]|uniref:uncharacterized protein LOC130996835 n=1 Tax=Salvia miltiorrhiza TaxID=226208 RepID=UPI0025ABF41E|nr:uncharacterized protein LOC130996835 [Salvia miltiorrhiza]
MTISLSPSLSFNSYLLFFMQDPKNSHTRRRWYQRAIEASTLWKALSKPIDELIPIKNITLWKTRDITTSSRKLRKCASTRAAASSLSHVCLCAPISDVFQASVVAPRRPSVSYARSRSVSSEMRAPATARMSGEGRRIFRGKSLTDDVLMRRFVVDEEATRRRNEMEMIRKRSGMRIRRIGPSPLSRMVLAHNQLIN